MSGYSFIEDSDNEDDEARDVEPTNTVEDTESENSGDNNDEDNDEDNDELDAPVSDEEEEEVVPPVVKAKRTVVKRKPKAKN